MATKNTKGVRRVINEHCVRVSATGWNRSSESDFGGRTTEEDWK